MQEGRELPDSVRQEARSLEDPARLEPWIACLDGVGRQSMWYLMRLVIIHGRHLHQETLEVGCPLAHRPSHPMVGALVARRAVDRMAEVEETAGRPEEAAAVAPARGAAAQAPVATGPAEDLGVSTLHVEEDVAKDEDEWEGGRRKATRPTVMAMGRGIGTRISSHPAEAVVRRPRQTHFCRSWSG